MSDSLGYDATPQNASDRAEPGPGSVPSKPEAGDSDVMRDGMLIRVCNGEMHTANGTTWTMGETLVGTWGTYLIDDRTLS